MTARTAIGLFAAGVLWLAPALAADLPVRVRPKPAPAKADAFTPPDATCLEWTDGCRTCQKPPAGDVVCSNVGIACVSQAARCTRR